MKRWLDLPLRTKLLFSALLLLGAVYVFSYVQTSLLEKELDGAAQDKIDELRDDAHNDLAFEVTASKTYVLFGDTKGKIVVFVRPKQSGEEPRIHSVELYYGRQDGHWQFEGSGASADEASHQRGLQAFARQ